MKRYTPKIGRTGKVTMRTDPNGKWVHRRVAEHDIDRLEMRDAYLSREMRKARAVAINLLFLLHETPGAGVPDELLKVVKDWNLAVVRQ